MLDQSFSANNFETLFNILNRQGKVEIDSMSAEYKNVVSEIHTANEELQTLRKKKKSLWTEEEVSRHAELQEALTSLKVKKALRHLWESIPLSMIIILLWSPLSLTMG